MITRDQGSTFSLYWILASALTLALPACSAEHPEDEARPAEKRTSAPLTSGFKMPALGEAPAPYYLDKLGRRWDFVREVTSFASPDVSRLPTQAGPSSVELDAMSDREFADRMRGVALHAGRYEYVQAEPDVALIKEARALERVKATLRAERLPSGDYRPIINSKGVATPLLRSALGISDSQGSTSERAGRFDDLGLAFGYGPSAIGRQFSDSEVGTNRIAATLDSPFLPGPERRIGGNLSRDIDVGADLPRTPFDRFGLDERRWATTAQVAADNNYKSSVSFGPPDCSGRLVGPSTMLSAAHCFYSWGSPGHWYPLVPYMLSGLTTRKNLLASPPTTTTVYSGFVSNCFSIIISGAYSTAGYKADDWAVIDTDTPSCYSGMPGSGGRATPIGIGTQAEYETTSWSGIDGYDSNSFPPSQPPGSDFYVWPSMIVRDKPPGNVWFASATFNWVLQYTIDTDGGASGAGVRQRLGEAHGDLYWYTTAIHGGGYDPMISGCSTPGRNCGRRVDWPLYSAIVGFNGGVW